MKKLIEGIIDFRKKLTPENRELFAKLALGQTPDALFIGCADSRVVPNLVASTDPGDLFVLRNVGNLIPPKTSSQQDTSAIAAVEFSVFSLSISDIIICGHSECGAMQALASLEDFHGLPHLEAWLQYGKPSLKRVQNPNDYNLLSQMNVLQQMEHLLSYPFIKERIQKGDLRLHGWWFEIAKANVYCYEESLQRFVLIDEEEAKLILERLM